MTLRTLDHLAQALGARLVVRLDWNGAELARLLDGDHAALVDAVIARLRAMGWECDPEVTFSVFGERGSIDILAWHPSTRSLLVIEVKTVVPDVGNMLATLDRKARLATDIATRRGWRPTTVSRLLIVREGPTARRHVAAFAETFDRAFPLRNVAVRRWLAAPMGSMAGLWFFSIARHPSARVRVRRRGPAPKRDGRRGSSRVSSVTSG